MPDLPAIIPAEYLAQPVRADVGRRLMQAVAVIATTRQSTWPDLRMALAGVLGVTPNSGGVSQLLRWYLPESGLAETACLPTVYRSTLNVLRLTERGKALARVLDVEPIENDWERVIRWHQGEAHVAHTGLLLDFERRARLRGYTTTLVPEVWIEGFAPDVWIMQGDTGLYVEVEGRFHHPTPRKWRAARRAQGFAAIVARTPQGRRQLVKDCEASGVAGIATDLVTLHRRTQRALWVEAWAVSTAPASRLEYLRRLVGPPPNIA